MDSDNKKYLASIRDFSAIGLEMGLGLGLCLYLGYLADKKWGTDPWGIMIGSFFGLGVAASTLYKAYKRLKRLENSTDDQ